MEGASGCIIDCLLFSSGQVSFVELQKNWNPAPERTSRDLLLSGTFAWSA